MPALPLICHPATPCDFVQRFTVRIDTLGQGRTVFHYRLDGDIDRLRLPPRQPPCHVDELWRHTCFEAFIAPETASAYLEFNFSPSRTWAIYRFDDYRAGMRALHPEPAPRIVCRRRLQQLETDVVVQLDPLIPYLQPAAGENATIADRTATGGADPCLSLGLSAVLEDLQGRISYWALAHPLGRPDFHCAEGFVAQLPLPPASAPAPAPGRMG
ncbi:hypothetical protein ACG33_01795 [Steroidobacter denitrificans]|uniref:DOMON-like domain-containing protein n=1 Tax=Steroidobacter denitrificans TaxID=465721 RepID=A0A127F8H4_STEDE|nr:DOMON-like domain-containing protein [Steroidobacter denitrificans]AMN45860.1 hypothetical protein ACG33_01795 [Steroidobacter denitrificans]